MSTEILRKHQTPRLSQSVSFGNLVFLAGQIADDGSLDAAGQTQQVLDKIDRLLKEAGSSRSHLLWCILFLGDIRHREQVNRVWEAWIDPKALPARTSVEVKLALPGHLIEITVIAAIPTSG